MEYTEHYDNMEERDVICKDYESRGLRMLQDNFDSDWQRGDEPHGILVFTDELAPQAPEPEPVMDYKAEIDKLKARIAVVEKR